MLGSAHSRAWLKSPSLLRGLLAQSNGCLPLALWLMSPAGWLPRSGISSGTLQSAIKCGRPSPFLKLLLRKLYIFSVTLLWMCCVVPVDVSPPKQGQRYAGPVRDPWFNVPLIQFFDFGAIYIYCLLFPTYPFVFTFSLLVSRLTYLFLWEWFLSVSRPGAVKGD